MVQKIEIDPRIAGVINLFVEKVEGLFFRTQDGAKALEIFAIANIKYYLNQVEFVKEEADKLFTERNIRMRNTEKEFWEIRFDNYFKEAVRFQADVIGGAEAAEEYMLDEVRIIGEFMIDHPKDLEVMTEKLKMARQGIAPRT